MCDAVVRSGAVLSKRNMPTGSFLFLGTTGMNYRTAIVSLSGEG